MRVAIFKDNKRIHDLATAMQAKEAVQQTTSSGTSNDISTKDDQYAAQNGSAGGDFHPTAQLPPQKPQLPAVHQDEQVDNLAHEQTLQSDQAQFSGVTQVVEPESETE